AAATFFKPKSATDAPSALNPYSSMFQFLLFLKRKVQR
ncbi:MAG: hypothetical protein ACI9Z7_001720, partial [Alteromonas macleodii]